MLHVIATIALAARVALPASDTAQLRREALMATLKQGGYTVLLRHARTDYSFNESLTADIKDRSAQRNLSDEGIADAALMGVVFRKYGITFSEILASPMFRTVETAEMAAGTPKTTMLLRVFPTTEEQRKLVWAAPRAGTNRLLVTHHFVIETHVPGVKPGDVAESEAAIVKHLPDGTIQLVGYIKLGDWRALANPGTGMVRASDAGGTAPASGAVFSHGPPAGFGATRPGPVPDTHVGHLAHDYVGAFNSGDTATMRKYIETYMVADATRPTAERLKSYVKLFDDHGPLMLVGIDSSTSTMLSARMKGKRGELVLTMKSTEADPMHVHAITFTMMEQR